MSKYSLDKELKAAKDCALKAAEEIIKIYNTDFDVEYKSDKSPLTLADKKSNDIITGTLKEMFPEYAILAEESEDDKSRLNNEWCWVIDPLDGTKEFLKKNDEFTVNIALSHKNKSVLGVVYIPVKGELYFAVKGMGAFSVINGVEKKLSVSANSDDIRLVKSRSHASDKLKQTIDKYESKIKEIKSAGSSLKGCLIATGDAEVYYRFGPTMEWDTAAMQCIVEEAGGVFMQLDDTEMLYNRENSLNDKGFYILNTLQNKFDITDIV